MRDRRGLCGRMIVGDGRRARLFLILGRRMAFKSTVCSGRIWDWPTNHALKFYSWSEYINYGNHVYLKVRITLDRDDY